MAAAVHTAGVLAQLDKLENLMKMTKEETYETTFEKILAAAKFMEQQGKTEEVKKLRAALEKLHEQFLQFHRTEQAAKKFKASYAPGPTLTDFAGELAKLRAQTTPQEEKDELENFSRDLRKFDQDVWDVHHDGEPLPGDELDDDDVVVAGGPDLAKNNKCPICMKEIMVLQDPVEDKMGIVYCKACIEHFIGQKQKAKQPCKCPQAGTTHEVRKEDLKPAKQLIREQKRAAKKGASAAAAGGSQKQKKAQVVIDEDDDDEEVL